MLEGDNRDDVCVVPGPLTDLEYMFHGALDGPNRERAKQDKSRISSSLPIVANCMF